MQMTKYYPTDELVPGMVTAGEVRTKGGQLIVENGVSLTDRLISRIKFYAIPQVSVTEDPIPATKKEEQVEVPSHVVKPEAQAPSYSQKVVCSKEFQNFQISYSRVIATYRTVLEDCVIYHKSLNYEQLLSDTKELYYSCKTSLELFDMLHNMRSVEDSARYTRCCPSQSHPSGHSAHQTGNSSWYLFWQTYHAHKYSRHDMPGSLPWSGRISDTVPCSAD